MPAQAYNPFPGLRPFEFDDNPHFFGRDEQTTELTTRLRKNRFVAVVGTSGSGKSSLAVPAYSLSYSVAPCPVPVPVGKRPSCAPAETP